MPRRARRHRYELNADVNVVSLIDVMLLLLVIFMITAPMMQGGVDLALPQAQAKPLESKGELAIDVTRDGRIHVNDATYDLASFKLVLPSLAENHTQNGVNLRVDRNLDYGTFVQIIAALNANGVTNVGLVAAPESVR